MNLALNKYFLNLVYIYAYINFINTFINYLKRFLIENKIKYRMKAKI